VRSLTLNEAQVANVSLQPLPQLLPLLLPLVLPLVLGLLSVLPHVLLVRFQAVLKADSSGPCSWALSLTPQAVGQPQSRLA